MVALDKVYCSHYREDYNLQECLDIISLLKQTMEAKGRYTDYLVNACIELKTLSLSPQLKVLLEAHNFSAFGIKYTTAKLDPLFGPSMAESVYPF